MVQTEQAIKEALEQETTVTTTDNAAPIEVKEEAPLTEAEVRKAVTDYFAMPEVKKNLRAWAEHLDQRFHSNWFDFEQVLKKSRLKQAADAQGILNFLCMTGLAHRKITDKGIVKYKITLNIDDKIALLQKQADELENQKQAILREIETLSNKKEDVAA